MKTCYHCKQCKPVSEFSKNRSNKDGYQYLCKCCSKQYYAKTYIGNAIRNVARRKELRNFIDECKRPPCMDCGNSFPPFVMDFDHVRGDKVGAISQMAGGNWTLEALVAEIDKCDLVCSNCHRIRTFSRLRGEVPSAHI